MFICLIHLLPKIPQTKQALAVDLGFPTELDDETLLRKTPNTFP